MTREHTTAPSWLLLLPQRIQGKENSAHLGFFLTWGQHVASTYCTSHGTDITKSECTLLCSCVACGFGRFQTSTDAVLLFEDEHEPRVCMPCLPSTSVPWQTCAAGTGPCSAEPTVPKVKSEISS